jgi:hypothetical protein
MASGDRAGLRHVRDELTRIDRTDYGSWRIATRAGNLALDRPARQSSCSTWSRRPRSPEADANAAHASGGNCGILTGGFCFHTSEEASPWWAVDLQRVCTVEEVHVYNPLSLPERARGLLLEIGSDGAHWTMAYRKPDERTFAGKDDPLVCHLPAGTTARHVRVRLA